MIKNKKKKTRTMKNLQYSINCITKKKYFNSNLTIETFQEKNKLTNLIKGNEK